MCTAFAGVSVGPSLVRPGGTGAEAGPPGPGQPAAGRPAAPDASALLDRLAAELGLSIRPKGNGRAGLVRQDGTAAQTWRENYPYEQRLDRKAYESVKRDLQIELLKLQGSVKAAGQRLLVVFEGRDAAGKGGTIKRFTQNLNPRGTRVVALDKPAAHERNEDYLGRYLPHLPGPGEIVLFDRSWYNRAGVERVMGFCQPEEYARFLNDAPEFERRLISDGVIMVKFWFSVSRAEQLRRFVDRHADPVKRWKLSQVDLASLGRWDEYTRAKEAMFTHTDLPDTPWTVIKSNDKRRARVEAMRYVLWLCDYHDKRRDVVGNPDPLIAGPTSALGRPMPSPVLPAAPDVVSTQTAGHHRSQLSSSVTRGLRKTMLPARNGPAYPAG